MSTSRGDSMENISKNRQLFLDEYDISELNLAQAKQISSDGIQIVEKAGTFEDCDAMITNSSGVFLSILTADCSPILLWSNVAPVVAAVHSGWQGSELDLLGKTIEKLLNSFAISTDSLNMVIGPGLSQENFEVGPEFTDKFPDNYLKAQSNSPRYQFDNNSYLRDVAISRGVPKTQIEVLDYCSFRDEELFFSHRRDKNVTGRMMSVIGMKK